LDAHLAAKTGDSRSVIRYEICVSRFRRAGQPIFWARFVVGRL
jgi:hypothetical protein